MFFRVFGSRARDGQRLLTKSPFEHASDLRAFYINEAYREAFITVRYGIELRLGLLVLSGESGVGKTTLVKLVGESAKKNVRLVVLSARAERATRLLDRIIAALGLDVPAERRAGAQALQKYLIQQSKAGQIVAIVIDDAHELGPEDFAEVKTLLSLRSEGRHLLQIVLVGGPALASFDLPGFKSVRQRIRVWSRIPPLASHEVEAYIEHKLASAGGVLPDLFRPGAVTRIVSYSRGIPKAIDALCDHSLRLASRAWDKQITESVIEEAWKLVQSGGEPRLDLEQPRSQPKTARYAEAAQTRNVTASESFSGRESRSAGRCLIALANAWRSWTLRALQLLKPIVLLGPISKYGRWSLGRRHYHAIGPIMLGAFAAALMIKPGFGPPPQPEFLEQARALTEPEPMPPAADELRAGPAEPLATSTTPIRGTIGDRSSQLSKRTGARSGELVYLHTTEPEDFRVIEDIGAVLRSAGYIVGDTIFTRNNTQGDVRFFFAADRRAAESVKRVVEAELQTRGYPRSLQLLQRDGRKFHFAAPGKIEVWLPGLSQSDPR